MGHKQEHEGREYSRGGGEKDFQAMSVLHLNASEERLTTWPFPQMIALWDNCPRELCMLAEGISKAKGA